MTELRQLVCLLTFFAGMTPGFAGPTAKLPPPTISRVARSPRTDGVWHDISVSYRGKAGQKLTLTASWDANTPAENGKGTVRSKSQIVRTNARGYGNWKMMIKGYPAGKVRAQVRDGQGRVSAPSAPFDMPWLY